ncbi:MAG: hypothetical protein JWQ75_222 [Pseudarthrobacter sp.]|nr:hypothetical protein [Pseudarthrobacter sp.]
MLAHSSSRPVPNEDQRILDELVAGIALLRENGPENTRTIASENVPHDFFDEKLGQLRRLLKTQSTELDRLASLVLTLESTLTIGPDRPAAGKEPDGKALLALAQLRSAEAQLGFRLAHRSDITDAVVATVRELVATKHPVEARSLSLHLTGSRTTLDAGRICAAIVASGNRLNDLAKVYLEMVPEAMALKYASTEWYKVQFETDASAAFEHFKANLSRSYPSSTWICVIRNGIIRGRWAEVRDLCSLFLEKCNSIDGCTKADVAGVQFVRDYFNARIATDQRSPEAPLAAVRFGVWDARQPDNTGPSADLGLHLETLVILDRIAETAALETADSELAAVLERRIPAGADGPTGIPTVEIVPVWRYMPDKAAYSGPIWTVYHGSFAGKVFGAPQPFPSAESLSPIFWGFHVEDMSVGDPHMLAVLKAAGPVGCRDWTTTYWLLGRGIDAFHSGPVASLAQGAGQPDGEAAESLHTELPGLISRTAGNQQVIKAQQKSAHVRSASIGANVATAAGYFDQIRRAKEVLTPHLETFGICTALGIEVVYTPPRSGGAGGPDAGISSRVDPPSGQSSTPLESTLELICSGAGKEAVYSHWQSATAALVLEAKQRFARTMLLPKPGFDVQAAIQELQQQTLRARPAGWEESTGAVQVAMACDSNLFGQLAAAIGSIRRSSGRRLHIHLLARGLRPADFDYLAALFPDVAFDFIPCDGVNYGNVMQTSRYITVSTIDRLLLPSLLETRSKIVYLDVDLMVLSDVGQLFDISLKSIPLAACSATADWSKSGFNHLVSVSQRLAPKRAAELKHYMLRTHHRDFLAFNAGVMVLNLEQMREDNFCERFLGHPGYFDMNDQDVLYSYAGGNRRELHPSWNCIPSHVYGARPKIVHWAGPAKPWHALRMPYQNAWFDLVGNVAAAAAGKGLDPSPLQSMTKGWF